MPVIPESFEPSIELVPLEWRPVDLAPGLVAYSAVYGAAGFETYELTAAAREHDAERLYRFVTAMRVWFTRYGEPMPPPTFKPEPRDLPRVLEPMDPRRPAIAVQIAYRSHPFVFRIDPRIGEDETHTWTGTGDVDVTVSQGEVELSDLKDDPTLITIPPHAPTRSTTGQITVKGTEDDSNYRVDGTSAWTQRP
jgi:hypothetical protein